MDPPQRVIRGSVGALLQQRRQQPLSTAKTRTFASSARQLINRTTAAKSKPKVPTPAPSPSGPSEPSGPVAGGDGPSAASNLPVPSMNKEEPQEEKSGPSTAPTAEVNVHPVFDKGEISSFASVGKLRSAPDPANPQRVLWYMQLGEDQHGPLLPLHQLPSWVQQALSAEARLLLRPFSGSIMYSPLGSRRPRLR